mgnify:CR=1 FL=1
MVITAPRARASRPTKCVVPVDRHRSRDPSSAAARSILRTCCASRRASRSRATADPEPPRRYSRARTDSNHTLVLDGRRADQSRHDRWRRGVQGHRAWISSSASRSSRDRALRSTVRGGRRRHQHHHAHARPTVSAEVGAGRYDQQRDCTSAGGTRGARGETSASRSMRSNTDGFPPQTASDIAPRLRQR